MSEVRAEVEPMGRHLVVRLTGELTVATAPAVRTALTKCLAEQPDALVADLSGLTVPEPHALTVFRAVTYQAALWPGTPMLLCVPDPVLVTQLRNGGYGRRRLFATVAEALAVPSAPRLASISDIILPVSGASRQARQVVTAACERWELPHLAAPASLVAGELVTNAAVHARTLADLRLTRGHRYLMIAVRDGSTAPPRASTTPSPDPAAPRGLLLVESVAHRWGTLPALGGKVVWATLQYEAP
ncbi:STAS domain-containing protein [Symbioplanes lichenis]|uniref:STAS domain-containing protein n=1 Tax=Symbioplanes lichenis TaxID=1629072 RepID=UPI002738D581|nr:STAS domain-containing protein [Actinoplanes lichenis]